MQKINTLIDPLTDVGIFQAMHTLDSTLEYFTDENVKSLDIEYYYSHSGEKYTSRFYDLISKRETDGDIESAISYIANIILLNCKDNWNNIYTAYTTDYSPLDNYNMSETETVASKVTNSITSDASVYGFNSSDAVPNSTVTNSSTSEGSADDNIRTVNRSGNIGVTTSQQMLESELSLRKYKFYHQIMNDIDKYMCLLVY